MADRQPQQEAEKTEYEKMIEAQMNMYPGDFVDETEMQNMYK